MLLLVPNINTRVESSLIHVNKCLIVSIEKYSKLSINKAFNVLGNGAIDCYNVMAKSINSGNITEAVTDTFKQNGKWDVGRIAGAGFVAGAGMRVATGGGLYRDNNGSQDIIGIPFI